MTTPTTDTLWAMHVQGPDDVIAMTDRAEADRHAKQINDWFAARQQEPDFDPETYPRLHAEVIEWPYDAEAHADALREQAEEA